MLVFMTVVGITSVIALVLSCVAITIMSTDEKCDALETDPQKIKEIKPVEAFQMSTYSVFVADKAIDGNAETFTNTNSENNPWWSCDMGGVYHVRRVEIANIKESTTSRSTIEGLQTLLSV